ncbi:hypothetical protein WDU94_011909 [Cyamophila willieti]
MSLRRAVCKDHLADCISTVRHRLGRMALRHMAVLIHSRRCGSFSGLFFFFRLSFMSFHLFTYSLSVFLACFLHYLVTFVRVIRQSWPGGITHIICF